MSAVNSNLLFIGQWDSELLEKWGAQNQLSATEVIHCNIVIIDSQTLHSPELEKNYLSWKSSRSQLQILALIDGTESYDELLAYCQKYEIKQLFTQTGTHDFDYALMKEVERNQEHLQNEQLSFLQFKESEKLLTLQNELEARVEKRTRFLSETRRKLFISHERMEAFQRLLVQLPKISSLIDLEKLLNENLSRILEIQWIRIFLHPLDEAFLQEVRSKVDYQIHRLNLYDRNEKSGSIFLMGSGAKTFSREESDFLDQVTEVISLKIESLSEFEKLQTLRYQWQKTFESIAEPLLLIDHDYNVLQSNRESSGSGKKCFRLLFQRSSPCEGCQMGKIFQLQQGSQIWEVRGQPLEGDRVFAHFYRNMTSEIDLQKRRIETSRLVEMGTISSSLAHELNNPLAGLLTFAQMLRMDLKDGDPIKNDVIEIEAAVLKCRDIVQNMLLYARDPGLDAVESVDLVALLQRFVKMLEIPSRTKGLKIKALLSDKPIYFETRQTWLLSVWKSLGLQALRSLEEARKMDPSVRSEILVSLSESAHEIQWNLEVDASLSGTPEADSVILNFEKILKELECELSFERVHGRGTRAKITFKRDSRLARKP
jgi:two-component system NtrC family sensor kinase